MTGADPAWVPTDCLVMGRFGMLLALLAAFACLLSVVSTFAMWEAVRAGHAASIGPIAGLGATTISGLLCILLASQHRWFRIVLLTLAVAVSAVVAAYVYVEPFRQWLNAALAWAK